MAEGIDEFDELDDVIEDSSQELEQSQEIVLESEQDPVITELLKSRGIEDSTKIKFEGENGDIEEVNWNSLDTNDKLNILNSSERADSGLDASETELINAIRSSQLTPAEYVQYLQRSSVENYINNSRQQNYSIDQYTDDELYIMDLLSKASDVTDEEALEALEKAKSNEALYSKQIGAIRNEYKKAEDESLQYAKLKQELDAQLQFNQFAESIENSIINFKEFSGCELNMSNDEMQDLYTFIVGQDNAGNNWFSKALQDPNMVTLMAWFVLYGDKMIQDMNDYYKKEITNVRKESYNKGLKDAKDKPSVAYKPKGKNHSIQDSDDLDEEF